MKMMAKCFAGMEEVLAQELRELGAREVKPGRRGVSFEGDLGFLYKANLWLRTALRILVPISEFKARNENEIYKKVKLIDWPAQFDVDKTFIVKSTVFAPHIRNSLFVAQKVKDAVADSFRERIGRRPNVDKDAPDVVIDVHVDREKVAISLDSSGLSLHRRGYREKADKAPINEVLAAGLLKLAGWKGLSHFTDPMCGSGTFLIEAALIAYNIPPGVFRNSFAFQNWRDYDPELYELIFESSLKKEKNFHFSIKGYDNDAGAVMKARRNVEKALLSDQIEIQKADFISPRREPEYAKPGMLLFNPPYGEKIEADIPSLYRGIGDSLKKYCSGQAAWIFTASQEGLKNIGLRPSRKIALKNAQLDAWLVNYELYEGSKKHIDEA